MDKNKDSPIIIWASRMLKRADVGAIFSGIIIVVGLAFIVPQYYQSYYQKYYQAHQDETASNSSTKIMFAFSINNINNMPIWCNDLSSILNKYDLRGTVFFSGNIAEKYPGCVKLFSLNNDKIDVGSQTYSYINLTSISDYTRQLNEVIKGKIAVDNAGKIESALFKAPYGSTDQNIYSLLSRSGILADFSYANQYNKYENGEFIKYDLRTYDGSSSASKLLDDISSAKVDVVVVNFDNSIPINKIDTFISEMRAADGNIQFINASEITGMNLNTRK